MPHSMQVYLLDLLCGFFFVITDKFYHLPAGFAMKTLAFLDFFVNRIKQVKFFSALTSIDMKYFFVLL